MTKPELERAIMTQELWVDVLPWRNDPLVYVWSRTNQPISLMNTGLGLKPENRS